MRITGNKVTDDSILAILKQSSFNVREELEMLFVWPKSISVKLSLVAAHRLYSLSRVLVSVRASGKETSRF